MYSLVELATALLVAFTTSLLTVYLVSKCRHRLVLTIDVHKPSPVYVPKIGGICILTSSAVLAALAATGVLPVIDTRFVLGVYVPAIVLGVVGLLDDLVGLTPLVRILASTVIALVVVQCVGFSSEITLIGTIRGVVMGSLLAVLTIVIFANAVNMLDVMNGIMPISSCIIFTALALCSLARGDISAAVLFTILLAQYVPLAVFNKYPARVLNGNVGSYITGAILGLTACQIGLYLELVIAALPYVINGLLILASTRGRALIGGRSSLERPIRCSAGILTPTLSTNCPLTLVRIVVLTGAKTEPQVVNRILLLFLACSLVAVVTTWSSTALQL